MSDVPTRQLVDETTQRVLQLLQQSGMLNDAKIDGAITGRAKLTLQTSVVLANSIC
jgi:hypothetical protein